jgi:leucyl aminopeptidase (aminopeptidase T)
MEISKDMLLRASMKYLERISLKRDETLLIITEPPSDRRVAESLFDAALQKGAKPMITLTPYRGEHNIDPIQPLAVAMKSVDAAITLIPYESADFYTKAFLDMLKSGTRMLGFLNASVENFINLIYHHDFMITDSICDILEEIISNAKEIYIRSSNGTDIKAELGGRPVQLNPGRVSKPGDEGYLPPGVVGQAPIEESWNGKVVFDAFIYPVGILKNPVSIEIKEGRIVSINGGYEAKIFQDWLESRNDPNIYWACHYGFGINPRLKRLSGLKFLDERMYGIFDIGFGTNDLPCFQGKIRANGHTDGLMTKASVFYDDKCIFEEGKFIHPKITSILESI